MDDAICIVIVAVIVITTIIFTTVSYNIKEKQKTKEFREYLKKLNKLNKISNEDIEELKSAINEATGHLKNIAKNINKKSNNLKISKIKK